MGVRPPSAPAAPGGRAVDGGARVLDGLVDGQDEAGRLGGCGQGVDAHHGRLPHARDEVIRDVLVVNIHTEPHAALQERGGREVNLPIRTLNKCMPFNLHRSLHLFSASGKVTVQLLRGQRTLVFQTPKVPACNHFGFKYFSVLAQTHLVRLSPPRAPEGGVCILRAFHRFQYTEQAQSSGEQYLNPKRIHIQFNFICIALFTIQNCHKAALQRALA